MALACNNSFHNLLLSKQSNFFKVKSTQIQTKKKRCFRCNNLYLDKENSLIACSFHGHTTDGEWSDGSGVIVYKWNEKGQMPNTGRANWKKRWSCCSEYDENAPPCRRWVHSVLVLSKPINLILYLSPPPPPPPLPLPLPPTVNHPKHRKKKKKKKREIEEEEICTRSGIPVVIALLVVVVASPSSPSSPSPSSPSLLLV
ncbi:hypothetical protein Dsin_013041 [Dipteronia sinensis]|uniref:Uncharacterized protein n=1 Tax=Dipteronia sinensis TaxID=43782 RepID=A0AAE0AJ68_9ROSI|nr:hypothetical protein Dsin_013041 [Dipteronia sinensis]